MLRRKRGNGYCNWWHHRVHLHVPQALAGIVADIKALHPDHIALTGDLVNVALPQGIPSRRPLARRAGTARPVITVIPGNHDVYVAPPGPRASACGAPTWRATASRRRWVRCLPDPAPPRRHRPDRAVDRRAQAAVAGDRRLGEEQIARAERLLAETGCEGLCRIVLIHHPPLTDQSRWKHLTDAAAFQAMIRRVGCEAILHGHNHRSEIARIAGPNGPMPVPGRQLGLGGAREQVRPRALSSDLHRARGRGLAARRADPRAQWPTAAAASRTATSCSTVPAASPW